MKILILEDLKAVEKEKSEKMIIDFYADWCGPCKTLSRNLEALSNSNEGKALEGLKVVKVNVDSYQSLAQKYNVRSLPTMVFLEGQDVVKTKVGSLSSNDLLTLIKETYEFKC